MPPYSIQGRPSSQNNTVISFAGRKLSRTWTKLAVFRVIPPCLRVKTRVSQPYQVLIHPWKLSKSNSLRNQRRLWPNNPKSKTLTRLSCVSILVTTAINSSLTVTQACLLKMSRFQSNRQRSTRTIPKMPMKELFPGNSQKSNSAKAWYLIKTYTTLNQWSCRRTTSRP